MRKIYVIPLMVICISFTGCAHINKTMSSWMDHNVNDLLVSWGPPQETRSDGSGGQILIYTQSRQWTTPGTSTTNTYGSANTYGSLYGNTYSGNTYGSATSNTTYTPPQTHGYNAYRMFWADENGRLYRWSWKGF